MKKLIVAASVACAALFANASSCDWAYYDESDVGDGFTFYVVNDATAGSLISMLSVDGDTDGFSSAISGLIGDGNAVSFTGGYSTDGYTYAEGTFSPAADSLFIIAVNELAAGKTFYYSDALATTDYQYDPPTPASTFGLDGSMVQAGTIAAPEPTSGLLLLIGVVGLALRRRRA